MIAIGAFSPLTGFQGEADFESVCTDMRLADGTVWPIPVVLSPADEVAATSGGRSEDRLERRKGPAAGRS